MTARNYAPYALSENSKKDVETTFDIGVMIALPEEFTLFMKYLQESTGIYDEVPIPKQFWADDLAFWRFDLYHGEEIIQVVAYLVGEMGTEYTSVATSILVEKWKVPFIVNIGVTGSFDPDLKVGSILVPTQITHYTANWKAKDSHVEGSKNVDFIMGTRAFATNRLVLSQFANYVTSAQYTAWKAYCERGVILPEQPSAPGRKKHSIALPEVHLGHLASGNMVVDSEHYKSLIKSTDRKLMACDMEAAGFAIAEQFLRAPVRIASQFVSLRCISDMAADKAEAEAGVLYVTLPAGAGVGAGTGTASDVEDENVPQGVQVQNREYAMRNATILFMFLVKDGVINASTSAQLAQLNSLTSALKARTKLTEARERQPTNQSMERLISKIKSQDDYKKLLVENKRRIIKHLKGDETVEEKLLNEVGIKLLQEASVLSMGRSNSAKKLSRANTDLAEPTSSNKKGRAASSDEPLFPAVDLDADLSSSESKSEVEMTHVSTLQEQVDLLSRLVQVDFSLPSGEVEKISTSLQDAIYRLQQAQNL